MRPGLLLIRTSAVLIAVFRWGMVLLLLIGIATRQSDACCGQDSSSVQESPTERSKTAASLEKIQKDFAKHFEKQSKMKDKYRDLETQLKKTEEDLQQINAEGMRQQLAAMQSAMQSMQLNAGLQILAGSPPTSSGSNSNTQTRDLAQMQLIQNRLMQNLDSTLRANQLQQLDAKSQAIVRKRIETIQAAVQLQKDWFAWQSETGKFYEQYWPYSDPEERWSSREILEALEVLEKRHDEDVAAKLVLASLLERQENHSEALSMIEEILKLESPLQPIAMMLKAKVLASLGKEKEAKQAMQSALKLDKSNPYLRWFRMRLAIQQEQWPIGESESKFLTTVKPMEKEARRTLALIYANRSKKSPGEGGKAVKEAQAALDLETTPDWYSHYVLAVANKSARKYQEAVAAIDRAASMVDDEELKERCKKVKVEIEDAAR